MRNLDELRKINKNLNNKVVRLEKEVAQLQFRLSLKRARINKLKEIMDLAIREKIL